MSITSKQLPGIVKWLTLWLGTWAIALRLWGGDPAVNPPLPGVIVTIFMIALGAALLAFPKERNIWFSRINLLQVGMVVGSMALFVGLSTVPLMQGLLTVGHVLFQQVMIAFIIFVVPGATELRFTQSLWRVLLFYGLSHVLLAFYIPVSWTLFFTIMSLVGAIGFTSFIQRMRHGIALSYILHLGFYFAINLAL